MGVGPGDEIAERIGSVSRILPLPKVPVPLSRPPPFRQPPTAPMPEPATDAEKEAVEIRCYFVRERNALAVRGDFGPLYLDYYLHLMQHGIRYEPESDSLLRDALAACALHLASKPRNAAAAWTFNLASPVLNLFVTGGNRDQNLTGRVISEGVRRSDTNLFFSQATADGQPARRSTVEFEGLDIFRAVEGFYRQSEQRPARLFRNGVEDFVMVTAQPECDLPWFLALDDEKIRDLDGEEELSLLERRFFRFDCGCDVTRIYPVIASLSDAARSDFFDAQGSAVASCPRCGASYEITREGLREFRRATEA